MHASRRDFLKQFGLTATSMALGGMPLRLWGEERAVAGLLPRSQPEAQGIQSAALLAFVKAIEAGKHNLHSVMVVRHGHVVAEGWWAPYARQLRHTLYSLSKSFCSTAVGLAADEGKLKLDDKVTSFFPKELPESVSPNLAAMQVKHLLMMGSGHSDDCLFSGGYSVAAKDWVRSALSRKVDHEPGTFFRYNSGATFLLSAIVETVTGEHLIDYLKPRLFAPLGIEGADWETSPTGIATGGWGLRVRTEDIARFGQLYLQKGMWNGKRLLSEAWVGEATSRQIDNAMGQDDAKKNTSDWAQGYGYQFWRCRNDGYRGDGAFGQFCVVLPEQDTVVAITSETGDMQGVLNLFWKHVLPAMKSAPLAADASSAGALADKMKSLALPLPTGEKTSPTAAAVTGKSFAIAENPLGISKVSLNFEDGRCRFAMTDGQGEHRIDCGLGQWALGQTDLPTVPLKLVPTAVPGETTSKLAAAGAWSDEKTFAMQWRFIETAHYDTLTCRFDGDDAKFQFRRSLSVLNPTSMDSRPTLSGRIA